MAKTKLFEVCVEHINYYYLPVEAIDFEEAGYIAIETFEQLSEKERVKYWDDEEPCVSDVRYIDRKKGHLTINELKEMKLIS